MLRFLKTVIKTSFLLLLFILTNKELLANEGNRSNQFHIDMVISSATTLSDFFLTQVKSGDTITTKNNEVQTIKPEESFVIPESLAGTIFNFQVNSDITYRSFNHFIKSSAKKTFFQAFLKEKELAKLASQTDSLRKIYSGSANEQKEAIAAVILKNEQKAIDLNQEIPVLYQNARSEEDLYWKSVSANEISKFQEKVKLFGDSINLANKKIQEQSNGLSNIDTLILVTEAAKAAEVKPEVSTTEIVYKIQIGAYKGKVPDLANKLIKKLSSIRKVENYVDDKGVKVFTTGNVKTYAEALTLQSQVKQEGVKTPIIAAYQKGKRITVAEAKKLNNEL
jgi:hypothetical protein